MTKTKLKSLREEMDDLAHVSVQQTMQSETSMQKLFMPKGDELIIAGLVVGPGTEIARAARMLVWEHEPDLAVLETEAWTVFASPGETDPDRLAVLHGKKAPSEIPEHKRQEALVMYGETPAGETLHMMWEIITHGGIRDLRLMETPDHIESRFTPLFVTEAMLRDVEAMLTGNANPLGMPPDELEFIKTQAPAPKQRKALMRRMVGEMLAAGGGGTTRKWQQHRIHFDDWDARAHE